VNLGDIVVRADKISKSFDGKILFQNLSFRIDPGAIVGLFYLFINLKQ
jgi:sulfate-transporting ATPase